MMGRKSGPIITAVASKHNVRPRDLLGSDRFIQYCSARREAARALRESGLSYAEIGRALNRHSTTIIHYCKDSYLLKKRARAREHFKRRSAEART